VVEAAAKAQQENPIVIDALSGNAAGLRRAESKINGSERTTG
jgi:hypothetical protein